MKNLYSKRLINKLQFLLLIIIFLYGSVYNSQAQVRVNFAQRTSQYTPTKKIYNVKGDFAMLGNTNLTLQNYGDNTNNNGQFMQYVDIDNDPSTFNSSSATLALSTENGAIPSCSNIIYAGLYWTGKSSSTGTFTVSKQIQNGTQSINNSQTVGDSQSITNTNYNLAISQGGGKNARYPIYTFSGGVNSYVFNYTNSAAPTTITVSVNGAAAVNVPVTITTSGTTATATLSTPYIITDGNLTIKINQLIRDTGTNLSSGSTQTTSFASVNISGTIPTTTTITKNYDKRIISLKGPNSSAYTQFTAAATDIYYPTGGTDDNIYTAYKEITDYVKTNGIGQYFAADIALIEGNDPGNTGYSGGWGMIVVYENSKMKYRDVTIFDGYAYVNSSNTTGYTLPISGFNTVQTGNVGVKLGLMASEGDVAYTGDYFQIQKNSDGSYLSLSDSSNSTTNFFNSSINTGGNSRNPSLQNNTGIDIHTLTVANTGNTVIGNSQTSTNFKYGTSSDTYSIFAIAMAVDAYVPEPVGIITTVTINNVPAIQPYSIQPGQDAAFNLDIKNTGTESVNNFKLVIPIPFNATYVPGSAVGTVLFTPLPTPNSVTFNPSLGATGSIVWDFGTLPLPADPNTILAKLSFKLKATTDCTILNNTTCGNSIVINGNLNGTGGITGVSLNGSKIIQGYTQNGTCVGQPITDPLSIAIDGNNYVQQNCSNTSATRNFSYCSTDTTVGTSAIASNFPGGSLFYNEFPVTVNSIQYSDANPIPLVAGSTVKYYAVPPNTIAGCNFPFTISKCPKIIAQDDNINGGNTGAGNVNAGNVLSNNGNGADTINATPATISQVVLTVTTPATPVGGNPVPSINPATGQITVPAGTPAGTYSIIYQICELNNISNCDSATVTVTVSASALIATADSFTAECSNNGIIGNILSNDLLNGRNLSINNIILTIANSNSNLSIDQNGNVSQNGSSSCGNYLFTYKICEKLNPTNCITGNATITITDSTPPTITCPATVSATTNAGCTATGVILGTPVTADNCKVASVTNDAPTVFPIGNTTVKWTVTDACGNTATCTQTVTIIDNQKPTVTTCAVPVNVTADNGSCTASNVNLGTPTFTDNCNVTQVNVTNNAPSSFPIGTTTVTWTIKDAANNIATCTQTVTVTDNQKPIITACAAPVNVTADNGACTASNLNLGAPTVTDNCNLAQLTITNNAPSAFPIGTTTVTWTIKDAANNATTCTQAVTVTDNQKPIITTCAAPVNVTADNGACTASNVNLGTPTVTDNCSLTQVTVTNNAPSTFPIGTSTVTWTIKDAAGNTATCTQTVTVTDNQKPIITVCAAPISVTADNGACTASNVNLGAPTVTDNCSLGQITITNNAPSAFPIGTTTVTWTVKDAANNIATCTQTVTVTDNQKPIITACAAPVNVTADNGACTASNVKLGTPTVTDNCNLTQVTITNNAPSAFPIGTTTVTWTVKDAANNTTTCTQTVTVTDNQKPTVTACAAPVNVNTDNGTCSASNVKLGTPTVTDNCSMAQVTITNNAPAIFPIGSTTVTWTIKDAANNTTTCTQTVTVTDNQKPIVPVLANVTGQCSATVPVPIASDNCAGSITATTTDPLVYNNQGTYIVHWTFNDGNGNITNMNQNVIVNNTVPPLPPVLTDVIGQCSATVSVPTVVNSCDHTTVFGTTSDPLSYSKQGTYIVHWTFNDGNGNIITANQNVIIKDTTAPTTPTLADVTGQCSASATIPTTTDSCAGTLTGTTSDPLTYNTQGTHVIHWTFNDGNGNSTASNQNVIVADNQKPTVTACALPINITADKDACSASNVNLGTPSVSDNCTLNPLSITNDAPATFPIGTTIVTWTFKDIAGNIATCTQTVTVTDNQIPTITTCAPPVNVTADKDACSASNVNLGAPTASDNCTLNPLTVTNDAPPVFPIGTTTVTWTIKDVANNKITCKQTVTVTDNQKPIVTACAAPVNITADNSACSASNVKLGTPTVTDNCTLAQVTVTNDAPSTFPIGTTTVTWTIKDAANNITTCMQTVTVTDNQKPTVTTCAAPVNVTADNGACTASNVNLGAPTVTDNCSLAQVTVTNDAPAIFPIGTTTVTWTIKDAANNTTTCTQTVTVTDNQKPIITACAAPVNVNADNGACTASNVKLGAPSFTDNCSLAQITVTNNAPSIFPIGTTTVTWTVKDPANNTATCTQTVTVTDNQKPTVTTCAAPVNVTADNGACTASNVKLGTPTVTDNCSMAQVTVTNDAPSTFSIGTTTVTWTVKDAANNTTTCTQTVTVTDNQKPTVTACAAPVSVTADNGACTASNVNLGTPTFTDNCSLAQLTATNDAPSAFPIGTTTVTWTIKDAANNIATCTQTVTVTDNQKPIITACAAPVSITADNDACTASNVKLGTPTVTDNCNLTQVTITNNAPSAFPIGTTTVTWTVKDAANNTTTCTQTVTVTDNQKPTVTACAAPVNVNTDNGTCSASNVKLGTPTVTDNCSMAQVTITNNAPAIFPIGSTTVTWTIKDAANNMTTCTQTVTVTDNQKPIVPVLANVTGQCSATVPVPIASDNCAGTITATTTDPLVYNNQGTYIVHWTFDDGNGNITNMNQNVIVNNTVPPSAPVLTDVIGQCSATVSIPTVVNSCDHTNVFGTTSDPLSYAKQGTYIVHWTFNDGNGNIITANQNVIIKDTTAPTTPTLADVTGECSASATIPLTTDSCAGTITGTTSDPLTYNTQGTHVIHWTFNDGNGNSTAANQNVIIKDLTKPAIPTLVDVTGECSATATIPTTTDACTGTITGTTSDPVTYNTQGTHVIHWTFNDGNGNSATANQNVIIKDVTKPVTPTLADVTGECSATVLVPTTTDACIGTISGTTTDPLTYNTQGTHIIHWTFSDGNGNLATANQNVIIKDVTTPVTPTLADVTGECSATAIIPTTTDACVGTISGTTTDPLTYNTQGTHVIHWTFSDGNGNSATANQNVIIKDVTKPVTPTLADTTGQCSATVTVPTTSDNCAGTITATTTDPLVYNNQGTYIVHWTFNDGNGNITNMNQNVIVNNTVPPSAPVLTDVIGQCSATVSIPTVVNSCDHTNVFGTTVDPLSYAIQGTYLVHWTFNDGNGNIITANQNVIIKDTTAPTTPTLADITGECSATATIPTTKDACTGTITGTTSDPVTYNTQGTHVIHWTFNDGNGNSATANQNVIIKDVTNPVTPTLADVTGECSATAIIPTTTDACVGTISGTTTDTLTYNTQGIYVIHWMFSDGNGNSTTSNQNVIIKDVTKPVTPTLEDVTGECSATAIIPTTTDTCAGTITGTTSDSLTYNTQGTHVIHWTFNDGNGNSTAANQNVIIKDVTKPVTPTLADVTGECSATTTVPTTTDACAGTIVGTTTDPLTYNTQGTHVIHWTFSDGNGNSATANQNVIIKDVTKPVIPTLADIIGQCSATVTVPTASDNCAGIITATTSDPLIYKEQGTFIVHWTFDDGNGNITTANQNVIVHNTIPPATPELADVTGECSATASIPTVVNSCYQNIINGTTTDPLTYTEQGTFVIHWTFDDGNGNIITANQNVIILDTTAPVLIEAPADVTVECSAVPTASANDLTATDNCDNNSVVITYNEVKTNETCTGKYLLTRTWTATDASGNSSSKSQKITVIDTTAPVFTSEIPKEMSVSCDKVPHPETMTATDNCGNATVDLVETKANGSCYSDYTVTRTWTATDSCGNTTSFTQIIHVSDTVAPEIQGVFQNLISVDCDKIPPIPELEFSDNCSGIGEIITPSSDDNIVDKTDDSYTIIRTWKVSDLCGNTNTFIQTINVTIKDALITASLDACNADDTTFNLNTLIPEEYVGLGIWKDMSSSGGLKGDNDGIFSPFGIPTGNYTMEYDINDPVCPRKIQITTNVNNDCKVVGCGNIIVHNFFSPNGDGYNDVFVIENINEFNCYPTNKVRIYNRWGALLFETEGYDNNEKAFRGISQAGATVDQAAELPSGTYFYVLEYTSDSQKNYKESGYLYLSR